MGGGCARGDGSENSTTDEEGGAAGEDALRSARATAAKGRGREDGGVSGLCSSSTPSRCRKRKGPEMPGDGTSTGDRGLVAGGAACSAVAEASMRAKDGAVARKGKHVVTFTGIKGPELVELQMAVATLGGECVPNYREGVTHVVCAIDTQQYTKRTLKYSLGLVAGAHLVTPRWVRASKEASAWRAPDEPLHSIHGCVIDNEKHEGPGQRARCPGPVFGSMGKSFYVTEELGGQPSPTRAELILLLRAGGANVLLQPPADTATAKECVVVYDQRQSLCETKGRGEVLALARHGASTVCPGFLMESVMRSHMHACVCVCVHVCMHAYKYPFICMCTYLCMHACM